MVRRLDQIEVKHVVLTVGAKLVPEMNYWTTVNLDFLGNAWEKMCASDACRAYALFNGDDPVGLFLGMMVPDLNSGRLQGLEYFWGVQKKFRGLGSLKLLRLFEADCKKAGCEIIMLGSIRSMDPGDRSKLYSLLGYGPHAEVFSKRLTNG